MSRMRLKSASHKVSRGSVCAIPLPGRCADELISDKQYEETNYQRGSDSRWPRMNSAREIGDLGSCRPGSRVRRPLIKRTGVIR